jgi:hypothetical protein
VGVLSGKKVKNRTQAAKETSEVEEIEKGVKTGWEKKLSRGGREIEKRTREIIGETT